MSDKNNQNITVTLPQEMIDFLDMMANQLDGSRSQAIRMVIRKYQQNEAIKKEG